MRIDERLRRIATLDLPYADARDRTGGRLAEVLVLFGHRRGGTDAVSCELLYIHRSEGDDTHAGQMAFPGGRCEGDEGDSPRGRAAVRETFEEVGIAADAVEVLGFLPELVSVTGYRVLPVLARLTVPIEDAPIQMDPREIQGTVWIPWEHLSREATYVRETITVGQIRYPIHVFLYERHRIWGLTGTLTKNLLDRWRVLG